MKVAKSTIWRMSPSNPSGEFVLPSGRVAVGKDVDHEGGFRTSSFELSNGACVSEIELDTLPGIFFDASIETGWTEQPDVEVAPE